MMATCSVCNRPEKSAIVVVKNTCAPNFRACRKCRESWADSVAKEQAKGLQDTQEPRPGCVGERTALRVQIERVEARMNALTDMTLVAYDKRLASLEAKLGLEE